MDYLSIINKYYPNDDDLRQLLLKHSRQVADRCLKIANKHKELPVDVQFLEEAAMLHDIGICRCDAPSILYISQKLGGTTSTMIGDVIESQFKTAYNPNLGAALSLALMVLVLICVAVMNRFTGDDESVATL